MHSLDELAAKLAGTPEQWDERVIVEALRRELGSDRPRFLTSALGAWDAPYLELDFTHEDGTTLKVIHGDGYSRLVAGGMDYRGYLDTTSLIQVVVGGLHGQTTYVELGHDEHAVADYFEVASREGQRLGYRRHGVTRPVAAVVLPAPLPSNVKRKLRISFEITPAIRIA